MGQYFWCYVRADRRHLIFIIVGLVIIGKFKHFFCCYLGFHECFLIIDIEKKIKEKKVDGSYKDQVNYDNNTDGSGEIKEKYDNIIDEKISSCNIDIKNESDKEIDHFVEMAKKRSTFKGIASSSEEGSDIEIDKSDTKNLQTEDLQNEVEMKREHTDNAMNVSDSESCKSDSSDGLDLSQVS